MRIDHIGIAVHKLSEALETYRKVIDADEEKIVEVPSEGVKIGMLRVGDSRIELLEPTDDRGALSKFLREKGEGLHHLSIEVDNLEEFLGRVRRRGLEVIGNRPRIGARGKKIAFVHPRSMKGVLLELVEQSR